LGVIAPQCSLATPVITAVIAMLTLRTLYWYSGTARTMHRSKRELDVPRWAQLEV